EFEDATIDLGGVEAAPSDIARLALLEYAFAFGNDVFALPLRLPMGTLTRITRFEVTDTFGSTVVVQPALRYPAQAAGGFGLFVLTSVTSGRLPALLLPPAVKHQIIGSEIEEVRLLRDEMANLVWAVEARVEGGDGRALHRAEEEAMAAPSPLPPAV